MKIEITKYLKSFQKDFSIFLQDDHKEIINTAILISKFLGKKEAFSMRKRWFCL